MTLVLYGPSGSGKTSFAAHFPRPGFICDSQERGIEFLVRGKLVPEPVWIDTAFPNDINEPGIWNKLLKRVWKAANDDSIDTLVVESVTGIENICFIHHCHERFDGDFSKHGFYSHWQGPKGAARFDWPELMNALDACYDAGKTVIVTAHSQTKEEQTPEGEDVMKYVPYCEKDIWARMHRWASGVFFFGRRIELDKRKSQTRGRAKPDVLDRLLYVEATPYCEAKNWFGLHGIVDLGEQPQDGFSNFLKMMEK